MWKAVARLPAHWYRQDMEILRTLGQIPLMFIGGFLIVLVVAAAWAFGRARSHNVNFRDL